VTTPRDEVERIRHAYAERARRGADDRYGLDDPANRFLFERRERALLDLLAGHEIASLDGTRVLDIGCGSGELLCDLVRLGARPGLLAGIDLLPDRIAAARQRIGPEAQLSVASAGDLPYPATWFDVALLFTVLSSILDVQLRRRVAAEAMRVLQPGAVLVIYDFTWNPLNPDVRGVTARELRSLFPACAIDAARVTLAPPIGRAVARRSPRLAAALEALPFLRSHLLVAVTAPRA
jgi:ubiquinone/menaquinone biosynthesis C-methylase UbiE